jgi:hypothetical protein
MTTREWDLTVPDDDGELLAELRRRGVCPGIRLHVVLSEQDHGIDGSPVEQPAFFGSFSGASDLAERTG